MPIHVDRIRTALALLVLSTSALAQGGAMTVAPQEQAQRDGLRLSILRSELADEAQALAQAQRRKAERAQAGDAQGVAEAGQALSTHQENIEALRSEIEQAVEPATAAPVRAAKRRAAGRPGKSAPRGWDVYDNTPPSADSRAGELAGTAAPDGSGRWNVYQGGATP